VEWRGTCNSGREPHDPNEGEPDESSSQRNVLGAAEDEEQGGRRLDQHRRCDDVGREAGVSVGVEGEPPEPTLEKGG
jgi:hypothetical protein